MGFWEKLKAEFIDIIEWVDPTQDTIVYRFERRGNEIKYGAKLTVREGQVAVFVNEGTIADVFQPGLYTLETQNMPILSTLKGWKYGFESPFKAEVYFVNTKNFTNQKWGTRNAFMLRDAEFGPIRLKAFGTYALKVKDAATFIKEIVATDGAFTTDEINLHLSSNIVTRFTDTVASSQIAALDLAANYNEISDLVTQHINQDFEALGVTVSKFFVENISFPAEVEAMLDKRSSMSILGGDMQNFTKFQTGVAMEKAAENPHGSGADAMGMGLAIGMMNQMGQLNQPTQGNAPSTPPPLPGATLFFVAVNGQQNGPFDLSTLGQMARTGSLTRESYIWKQGMTDWSAAGAVPELASVFTQVPPPLPG